MLFGVSIVRLIVAILAAYLFIRFGLALLRRRQESFGRSKFNTVVHSAAPR